MSVCQFVNYSRNTQPLGKLLQCFMICDSLIQMAYFICKILSHMLIASGIKTTENISLSWPISSKLLFFMPRK